MSVHLLISSTIAAKITKTYANDLTESDTSIHCELKPDCTLELEMLQMNQFKLVAPLLPSSGFMQPQKTLNGLTVFRHSARIFSPSTIKYSQHFYLILIFLLSQVTDSIESSERHAKNSIYPVMVNQDLSLFSYTKGWLFSSSLYF